MQQTLIHLHAQPQDLQVYSHNCCLGIIRSKTSTSQETKSLSLRKKNNQKTREKGIKLTNNKSSSLLNQNRKINIDQNTTTWRSQKKLHLKQININKPREHARQTENMNYNSTKKCIEYKNRRIVERISTQSCYVQNYQSEVSLKNLKQKTDKCTPRTTIKTEQEYAQLSQLIDKNYEFSMIFSNQNHNNPETKNTKTFFKPTKGKKTLSRLYQQQLGRRVVTVQSQDNESESDHLSIIEPFEWRIEFN